MFCIHLLSFTVLQGDGGTPGQAGMQGERVSIITNSIPPSIPLFRLCS